MPHIIVSRDDGTQMTNLDMAKSIDAELAYVSGFDSSLCKYRFVRHQEFTIQHDTNIRHLMWKPSVRCDIVTFDDRPNEVLTAMSVACLKGITAALALASQNTSNLHIAVSVATLLTSRIPYKTQLVTPQGEYS